MSTIFSFGKGKYFLVKDYIKLEKYTQRTMFHEGGYSILEWYGYKESLLIDEAKARLKTKQSTLPS